MTTSGKVHANAIVRGEKLSKIYTTAEGVEFTALSCVDIEIAPSQLIAIVGASGSGKSSLMHILGGIDKPSHGSVWIEGTNLSDLDDRQRTILRRRKIGFIFQSFNLVPSFNVYENVALPLRLDSINAAEIDTRVLESLEVVGLLDKKHSRVGQLSGGEQQRVAIARSLSIKPTILFGDEPTGNLDSKKSKEIVLLFREMVSVHKQTVVLVTHDPRVAGCADRVIEICDGEIRNDGSPQVSGFDIKDSGQ